MKLAEINAILAAAGQRPRHRFGQNFMVDEAILQAIVDAGEVQPGEIILEVGPGVGNLTRLLSGRVGPEGRVLAVDIDRQLLPAAQRHHADLTNVTWMLADVLASKHQVEPAVLEKLRELRGGRSAANIKLVSNLPYNAASPLIAELLVAMWQDQSRGTEALTFSRLAFTVQHEVALRMIAPAPPAQRQDYGPLSILIQSLATSQLLRKIPPGAFWPPPKVHSALVVVTPQQERFSSLRDALAFQKLLAGIFSHRRQTLGNALKHHYRETWTQEIKRELSHEGFDLMQRPEQLSPEQLMRLEGFIQSRS